MDSTFLHGVLALVSWVFDWHSGLLVLVLLVAVIAVYVNLSDRITALERRLRREEQRMPAQVPQPNPLEDVVPGDLMPGEAPEVEAVTSSTEHAGVPVTATRDPWQERADGAAVTDPFAEPARPRSPDVAPRPAQPAEIPDRGLAPNAPSPSRSIGLAAGLFSSGNWLVRSGLLVLFIGVGFLLKFAAEHSVFPLQLRLAGVGGAGLAMVIVGLRLAPTRRAYALALQGGGVGLIYLTLYASFALYGLLRADVAFAALFLVVVVAGSLAHRQQSQVLAVFAAIGGFSAPLLASTGTGSHVLLFAYYAVLNVGVLGLALVHAWRVLNLSGFVATFAVGAMWGHQFYAPEHFASVEPFLVLFFAMYLGIAIAFAASRSLRLQDPLDSTLVFGPPLVAFGLQSQLLDDSEYGLAFTAICLALVYAIIAWLAARRATHQLCVLTEAFAALAIGFATLAVPLLFDARWSSAAWALEGAALMWVGWRQNRPLARLAGALLQLLAGLVFFKHGLFSTDWHTGNWLGTMMLAVAGILSSIVLFRSPDDRADAVTSVLRVALAVWGLFWWFGGGFVQIEQSVSQASTVGISLLFVATSTLALEWLSTRQHWPPGRHAASSLPLVLVVLALVAASSVDHPFSSMAAIGWPLAICAFVFILRLRGDRCDRLDDAAHLMILWLTIGLLSWEFMWQCKRWLPVLASAHSAIWLVVPGASIVWMIRAKRLAAWPVASREVLYVCVGCGPVVAVMAVVVLFLSVREPGPASEALYLPILNPTDLLSACALVALAKWWHAAQQRGASAWRVIAGMGIGVVFVWLNGVLLRAVHFQAGVPWEFSAQLDSALVQASMSVLWASTALLAMVFGSRWVRRSVWMIGASLMLAVILKLLLVDLSSSGTIERIVSFICVGLLLMLVGYLAPVPPRRQGVREEIT
ncbi:MAG: putative membrane protein [Gammaproteobacteria bacterium]|jgi:uncharacterized membrane protein